MFTGIIETVAKVRSISRGSDFIELGVDVPFNTRDGDSIAINGVCLTVKFLEKGVAYFDVVKETLKRTNLSDLRIGSVVNLERSLKIDSRFDGHIILGHIDATGKIKSMRNKKYERIFSISYPFKLSPFITEKGSIAVDGISLTVVSTNNNTFDFSVIPYTYDNTNL
ncbi:riboflavin synthase [candidate division WOR-3 bacterium]|nr:riboflavin synthase [candidate division WOR-3 bacterium]